MSRWFITGGSFLSLVGIDSMVFRVKRSLGSPALICYLLLRGLLPLSAALGTCAAAFAEEGASAKGIRFERLDSQQTGLRAIFADWRAEEAERQKTETGTHGWWPWGLRAFDYDLDGDLDLLPSHHGRPTSILLRNHRSETGELKFSNVTAEVGLRPRELPGADDRPWIWDIDGDSYLDIAGFSDESKPNSALNQQGKQFRSTGVAMFSPLSHPREVLDLNGDGYLDVDGGDRGQWFFQPHEKTFRHDKTPRFAQPVDLPRPTLDRIERYKANQSRFAHVEFLTHEVINYDTLGYAPGPIDLNGDRLPDMVVQCSGGYGAEYLGRYLVRQQDGTLSDRTDQIGLPEAGAPILTADISGDAHAEILICDQENGGLYLADKSGKYARAAGALSDVLKRREAYLLRCLRADFDNDGDVDLVISSPRLGRETVFENRGSGEFTLIEQISGWDANPVVIADLDDDGRLDLIVGVKTPDKFGDIAIYLNRTPGAGGFAKIGVRMPSPNPYGIGSVVEVFSPGDLANEATQPIFCEKAHADATPVHVGLGAAQTFDLRVTFPDGKRLEAKGLAAGSRVLADSRHTQVQKLPTE